jgi:hypothetical protein
MTPKKKMTFIFLTIFLCLVSVELLSTITVYFKHDLNLWSPSKELSQKLARLSSESKKLIHGSLKKQTHDRAEVFNFKDFSPNLLYGFNYQGNTTAKNNYFLNDKHDFPYAKNNPEEFVIGIFGGSVASHLHQYILHDPKRIEKIQTLLNKKKIIFLNFSVGAMSQPQQSILHSLFVQSIDLSINLDGHNEMAIKRHSELPIEFPIASTVLLPAKDHPLLHKINFYKEKLYQLSTNELLISMSKVFHTSFLGYFTLDHYYNNKLNSTYKEYHKLKQGDKKLHRKFSKEERLFNWTKFIKVQHVVSEAYQKKSFFFLQPNPFSNPNKSFSTEELTYVHKDVENKVELSEVYTSFHDGIKELKLKDVQIFSLKNVFKDIKKTVYVDNCCHLNERGHRIILDAIFTQIAESLK